MQSTYPSFSPQHSIPVGSFVSHLAVTSPAVPLAPCCASSEPDALLARLEAQGIVHSTRLPIDADRYLVQVYLPLNRKGKGKRLSKMAAQQQGDCLVQLLRTLSRDLDGWDGRPTLAGEPLKTPVLDHALTSVSGRLCTALRRPV